MPYSVIVLLFILLNACSFNEKQDNSKYSKLDKNFELIKEFEKGMGAVSILHKGRLVYSNHYGTEKIKEPVYRIGSISKLYTAVIILKLIEEEKLELQTKLSKFYKDIDQSDSISVEHLLRHRSGLPNFTDHPDYVSYHQRPVSENEHISRFTKYKLEFTPDEKYSYSNTGYVLLSFIAQRVSSLTYSQLIEKYITKPLGLKRTYLYNSQKHLVYEVPSYMKGAKWEPASNTHETVSFGAGAIASTAEEVAIFIKAIFDTKLISEESLKKMVELKDGYGLGIFEFPYNDKKLLGHTGGIDGFRSIVGYKKEDDLAFVQLSNAMAMDFNDNSIAILSSFYGDHFELPKFQKTLTLPDEVLKRYVGTYSGEDFPLKLTFRYKDGLLLGVASGPGQSEISLEATSEQEFSYFGAGINLKFSKDGEVLNFSQGKTFKLNKER